MYYWNRRGMNGWGWFVGSGSAILFLTLVVLLVRAMNRGSGHVHSHAGSLPEQVLAERFARGEIDEEEYRRRLAVLRDERPGPTKHGPAR
ncbi:MULTISPECIES: SHOCT domain-containing protein [unclassified Streptomyces]|uniref:SHOCT domain-containing protein n=1 Tax=unclassified Streptomyces TaxID=2593676 RepID=UPI003D9479D1